MPTLILPMALTTNYELIVL